MKPLVIVRDSILDVDARNLLDPAEVRAAGIRHVGNVVPQGF